MEVNQNINFEDQIAQLLGSLQIQLNCCEIICEYLEKQKGKRNTMSYVKFLNSPITRYLITICNCHFFESISIFASLLHSKKGKEISFKNLELKLKPEFVSELDLIRIEFKNDKFLEFRQNISDHKNKNIILNPMYLNMQIPSKSSLQSLKNIFQRLNKFAFDNFDLTWFTNVNTTEKGLKDLLIQIDISQKDEKLE